LEQNELHVIDVGKMNENGKQLATELREKSVLQCLKKWDFCMEDYKDRS